METTTSSLLWAILFLLHYPEVQAKVQTEIDDIVGSSRKVSLDDKSNLPYTNAVLQESLRMATITPMALPHFTTEDLEVRGYTIPKVKKSIILLKNYQICHKHYFNISKVFPFLNFWFGFLTFTAVQRYKFWFFTHFFAEFNYYSWYFERPLQPKPLERSRDFQSRKILWKCYKYFQEWWPSHSVFCWKKILSWTIFSRKGVLFIFCQFGPKFQFFNSAWERFTTNWEKFRHNGWNIAQCTYLWSYFEQTNLKYNVCFIVENRKQLFQLEIVHKPSYESET